MNQQTLIMNLDDTLIHCNKYFEQSKMEFVELIKKWFITIRAEKIKQKQLELDLKSVKEHSLDSSKYPDILVSTYLHFCKKYGKGLKVEEIELIRKIGHSVFEIEVEPYPYMYEVLSKLREDGHILYLFTGGDKRNQMRKITQLGLQSYFNDRIFIFEHKNSKTLEQVLKKIHSDKKFTWMIGNSLRTDIKPALDLGINAIHIPSKIEWSYNIVDIDMNPRGTLSELPSLLQLPDFLSEHYFNFEAMEYLQ
jgi:putative hydrolase of the HAD superfamily